MLDLDSVKAWLRKTTDDRDDVLEALIARALDAVQRALDWYFGEPRDAEEILNGNGRTTLFLRQPPIDDDVTVYYRTAIGYAWTEVDADDFEVDGRKVVCAGAWWPGVRNYRFVYQEGFEEIPGDVEQLVLDLVKRKWNEPTQSNVVSESLGRYSYSLGDVTAAASWTDVMNHWKRGRA